MIEMGVSMVKVSSRGQIVIPKDIMRELSVREGDKLLVISKNKNLLLKKIEMNVFEKSLESVLEPMWRKAERKKLTEKDVEEAIKTVRKRKAE
ncbi:MAG: AbrB/MazE/SpoVT family DNA-binding domain-containing protein [Euryarchaeota archaeon]|nr:AbrB/MazE/SpoVT family DNA-binding domain-containing protein [Euryarchaeota archaeon]